jgi:hypothetical protein
MKSARATALFAAAFATVVSIDIVESGHDLRAVLVAIVLTTLVASIAFWIPSRKSTYAWYSAPIAALATAIFPITLYNWLFEVGRATTLASTSAALVLVPIICAKLFAEQKFRDAAPPLP